MQQIFTFLCEEKIANWLCLHIFVSSDEGSALIKVLSSTDLENFERVIFSYENCARGISGQKNIRILRKIPKSTSIFSAVHNFGMKI